jgi:putative ABC transport system permease protein
MLGNLWSDFRHAARTLALNPGFAAAAILAIAVGIGINAGLFSLLNGLALRDLPVAHSEELVSVGQIFDAVPARSVSGSRSMFSTAEYRAYRDSTQTLSGLMGYAFGWTVTLGGEAPREVVGGLVTCNFFTVLEQPLALGSGLPGDCDAPGRERVAVLGHDLWVTAFRADPSIVGRAIELNRQEFVVVGVTPEDFNGIDLRKTSLYLPAAAQPLLRPDRDFFADEHLSWLALVGRRSAGASIAQVRVELGVVAARLDAAEPGRATRLVVARANRFSMIDERTVALGAASVVMAAFGLVLLVACANVANLLLARGAARMREIAMRVTLGASRCRLVQQVLAESVLIALLGGVAGSGLALLLVQKLPPLLLSSLPPEARSFWIDASPDLTVIAFALGLSLATGVFFGLVPALNASRPDLSAVLKQDTAGGGRRDGWSRGVLLTVQVAVCMVLIGCANLLLRGLYAAQTVEPGFTYEGVTVASFDLQGAGYDDARASVFQRALMQRAAELPGVTRVAQSRRTPLEPGRFSGVLRLPGNDEFLDFDMNNVSADYFSLLDIPIVLGRAFTEADLSDTSTAVIITEGTARHYWPDESPLGKTLQLPLGPQQAIELEVVGVTADADISQIGRTEASYVYFPAAPRAQVALNLLVRSASEPATVAAGIRAAALALDPGLVVNVARLEDNLGFWQGLSRLVATLSAALGFTALLLAAIGVYGVVGYVVNRRVREMGIRLALGARPRDVVALMLRQTMRPVIVGVVLGLAAAIGVSRLLASLLFGVNALDPLAFGSAAAFVLGAALLAGVLPVRRATRVDPTSALRYE